MSKIKYPLFWGNAVCAKQSLSSYYQPHFVKHDLLKMDYAPDAGDETLIALTKKFIFNTTGINYKHVIITNGATGALNVVLRVAKSVRKTVHVHTHKDFFPYYPHIIKKSGMIHVNNFESPNHTGDMRLIDMPSNVTGSLDQREFNPFNTIWDSVYFNPVYMNEKAKKISGHSVNIGSFSKVLGLTGLRVGYIATNNSHNYKLYMDENLYESCTISVPSQELIKDILETAPLDLIYSKARRFINHNRETVSKIKHLFEGKEVQKNGMFYAANADKKAISILDKASVSYAVLRETDNSKFIRLNLGQDNRLTSEAIEEILKIDRV